MIGFETEDDAQQSHSDNQVDWKGSEVLTESRSLSGQSKAADTKRGVRRFAHGWTLTFDSRIAEALATEFIRLAVRAVPSMMACQLGRCHTSVVEKLGAGRLASQWTETGHGLEITIAAGPEERPHDQHDVTLELLLCLGQAFWIKLNHSQRKSYLTASGRRDRRRLDLYGAASFAGTAAEYVHRLWHDVVIRSGRDFLPALQSKRRLDVLSAWFPPEQGHLLFPQTPCQPEVG